MTTDIIKICAVGIVTAFCALLIKDTRSEIALLLVIAGGAIILLMVLDYITDIFSVINALIEKAGIGGEIVGILFKIIGIGYITEFSAGIIEESGSKSLADKVVFGGKVIILIVSLPIVVMLFNLIAGLMQ